MKVDSYTVLLECALCDGLVLMFEWLLIFFLWFGDLDNIVVIL